jgi:hypothetical protein
LDDSIE